MLQSRLLLRPASQLQCRTPFTPGGRSFHASAPRNDVYSTMLFLPHELLHLVHSSGLTWAYALPASAFIVRTAIVFLGGISTQKRMQRYMALNPLRDAISLQARKKAQQSFNPALPPSEHRRNTIKALREEIKKLHKRWNCAPSSSWAWQLWQFPAFLAMAETIRRMMGIRSGILGWLFNTTGTLPPQPDVTGQVQTVPQRFMEADHELNPWYTPSFAEEGMLWFENLLLPDPYFVLPLSVSGLMVFNVWWSSRTPSGLRAGKWAVRMRRMLYTFSVASLLITPAMPAGLVLYWASGSLSATIWHLYLSYKLPLPLPMKASKRPLLLLPQQLPK